MVGGILSAVSHFIVNVISGLGYGGVVLLMGIESANIPLPSEVIMPFSGYLVFTGRFNLFWVAIAGGLGCLWGSLLSYWIGAKGGRPLIEKYGKYVLISHHDLDRADRWFLKWGIATVFIGRLLPIIRTFISFPAGIARVNIWKFSVYTFVGSVIWSYLLAWVGMKLGENWDSIKVYFHDFDVVIGVLIVLGIGWWIYRHVKHARTT
ncbi:MAG: DedA family protein [Candidatus Berkelbacteria bacterium]|nr:DedA family protein [Candidatus Berkelbacteria bacterium]